MRREERNMDKLLISFLLSLFMVYSFGRGSAFPV